MLRWLGKMIGLCVFMAAGSAAIWYYQDHYSAKHDLEQSQEKNRVLARVVQRLSDETRRADLLVIDRKTIDGVAHSTMLFVEYDHSGESLPPKSFEILGDQAHIDAMVIKFDRNFVSEGDPLRGHSIALFTRIYGDKQSPEQAFAIDEPGKIPAVYRDADPRVTQFEMDLWKSFWKLANDATYRAEKGVRVANGQGLWGPFEPDMLYTITIESDGGLNYVSEPLKGIYREALKRKITPDLH